MRNMLGLAAITGVTAGTALLGHLATGKPDQSDWYRALEKPPFQPPSWIFAPVWSALYGMIGYSGYRAWQKGGAKKSGASLAFYAAQLGLNGAWSWLFFKKQSPRAALANIGLLGAAIAGYIWRTRKVDRTAALLFIPYLGWVAFASLLNAEIVRRNPGAIMLLRRNHRRMAELFDELEDATDRSRAEILEDLQMLIASHSEIEEELFYPRVRAAGERAAVLVAHAIDDHAWIEEQINLLSASDPKLVERAADLKRIVLEHIAIEEKQIFPIAKKALGRGELDRLGLEMSKIARAATADAVDDAKSALKPSETKLRTNGSSRPAW
jgi:tryptophan-rich sensory protein